jgi:ligand-binding SRPBCC domain-containing protein
MHTFSISIDVAASPDRVWQVMSDVDRWHEWTPSITSVKRLGDSPLAAGARVMIRQPKFPPAFWKVTDVQPGRSFTWVSVGPALRVVATHRVDGTTTTSRATLSLDYSGFFGQMLARMTRDITNRYLRLEAAGLKARSENPNFRRSEADR